MAGGIAGTLLLIAQIVGVAQGGTQSGIVGVWRVSEVTRTGPNARTIANPQPGMFIFTPNHYSLLRVNSDAARPELPPDQPTDKQLADAFRSITANSGSYEIKASEITLKPVVAKNPAGMKAGAFITGTFRMDGKDTLWLTERAEADGPIPNPVTVKLTRVE